MADRISVELTMAERFCALNLLPREGDSVTLKILRKLRETLAPSEGEYKEYKFQEEFRCPFVSYSDRGKKEQCEFTEIAPKAPKCPIHEKLCVPTGRSTWDVGMAGEVKEIWLGDKARDLIVAPLKVLCDEGKLKEEDDTEALWVKFLPKENKLAELAAAADSEEES